MRVYRCSVFLFLITFFASRSLTGRRRLCECSRAACVSVCPCLCVCVCAGPAIVAFAAAVFSVESRRLWLCVCAHNAIHIADVKVCRSDTRAGLRATHRPNETKQRKPLPPVCVCEALCVLCECRLVLFVWSVSRSVFGSASRGPSVSHDTRDCFVACGRMMVCACK